MTVDSDFCPCGVHAGQRKCCIGGSLKGKQESKVSCSYKFLKSMFITEWAF